MSTQALSTLAGQPERLALVGVVPSEAAIDELSCRLLGGVRIFRFFTYVSSRGFFPVRLLKSIIISNHKSIH